MAASRTFTLNLMGDVMLGRLIDQLFPKHVNCPEEAGIVSSLQLRLPHLKNYRPESPWGNFLPLIKSGDLNIINLETSATTHEEKWPTKVFNYRMHPANVEALNVAQIDYVSLANNHTLDFGEAGLADTVRTVRNAGIKYAGAEETSKQTLGPAELRLPRNSSAPNSHAGSPPQEHRIHAYSFSDHPQYWAAVPQFNFIDYNEATRQSLKAELNNPSNKPALKIASIHWGPNYSWAPSAEIKSLAHFLIDECGVDLIHGHSSHHIQGVEIHNGKLIIYGCGDFVDDYAVVSAFRNDLSALWRVIVVEEGEKLECRSLEVFPNRITNFRAGLLETGDEDYRWLEKRFRELCTEMGTKVQDELGTDGQILIEIS